MNNKDTVQDPSRPSFSLITKGSVLCCSLCSLGLEDYKRSPAPTKQTKSNSVAAVTGEVPASAACIRYVHRSRRSAVQQVVDIDQLLRPHVSRCTDAPIHVSYVCVSELTGVSCSGGKYCEQYDFLNTRAHVR